MNRDNVILCGFGAKQIIRCKAITQNFRFVNGEFYSYKTKIAFFQDEALIILDYTAMSGNCISMTTSCQVNKIKAMALRCNIDYMIVNPAVYEDEEDDLIMPIAISNTILGIIEE